MKLRQESLRKISTKNLTTSLIKVTHQLGTTIINSFSYTYIPMTR